MLSNRPSTPYPPSPIFAKENVTSNEPGFPYAEASNGSPKPPKSRLPTRMPSSITSRAGTVPFRSISERCGLDRPTFDLSSGPVPAVFRNKKIDMTWLKKVDLDEAFGPSRRSLSGSLCNQAFSNLSPDRGSRIISPSGPPEFEPSRTPLSFSTNGRSTLNPRSNLSFSTNERSTLSFSTR